MAERRMFAKTITNSDAFLEMPATSQNLYFHLSMNADDDGFINKPKAIMRMVGSHDDDLKLLFGKKFIIPFDNGVVVIKHWRINNYIQKDRYKETEYSDEKELLRINPNGSYSLKTLSLDNKCIQNGYNMDTQVRLGKVSIGKDSIDKKENIKENENLESASIDTSISNTNENNDSSEKPKKEEKHKHGEYGRILLTDAQYESLCKKYSQNYVDQAIKRIDEYVEMNNNKNHYKDFNLVIQKAINQKWTLLNDIGCEPCEQESPIVKKDITTEEAAKFFEGLKI